MNQRLLATIGIFSLLLLTAKISISRDTFAPQANTGAPNEGSCGAGSTSCHNTLSTQGQFSTDLVLTANGVVVENNFEYVPGTTYNMEFVINDASARNGFSLTTLNTSNNYVGSFAVTANDDAAIRTSNPLSRDYIGHTNTLGRSNWTFQWNAPSTGEGTVEVYASANRSNNNGTSSNDTIIPFRRTLLEENGDTTSINAFVELANEIKVLSNPIVGNVIHLQLEVMNPAKFTFQLFNVNGQIVQPAVQEVYHGGYVNFALPINDLKKGLYLLKVSTKANEFKTIKLMKL